MKRQSKKQRALSARRRMGPRLAAYALAGGAGLTAQQAMAAIVHTDIPDITFTDPNPSDNFASGALFDMNLDGDVDFTLLHIILSTSGLPSPYRPIAYIYPGYGALLGEGFAGADGPFLFYPTAMDAGDVIDDLLTFDDAGVLGSEYFGYGVYGNFPGVGEKFVGIKFDIAGAFHFGWILVEVPGDVSSVTLKAWAYETTPGTAIAAGAVPEPASLGMLALGAVGIMGWRQLRKKKASDEKSVA